MKAALGFLFVLAFLGAAFLLVFAVFLEAFFAEVFLEVLAAAFLEVFLLAFLGAAFLEAFLEVFFAAFLEAFFAFFAILIPLPKRIICYYLWLTQKMILKRKPLSKEKLRSPLLFFKFPLWKPEKWDMETVSFREVLRRKMGGNPPSKTSASTTGNPLPDGVSWFFKEPVFIHVTPPQSKSFKGYKTPTPPVARPTQKTFAPGGKTREKWVKKSQLDEISREKWARFEKMVGQNFGDTLSKTLVLKTFRAFLKKVHPDTAGAKAETQNFATLVKIKDELLAALTQSL